MPALLLSFWSHSSVKQSLSYCRKRLHGKETGKDRPGGVQHPIRTHPCPNPAPRLGHRRPRRLFRQPRVAGQRARPANSCNRNRTRRWQHTTPTHRSSVSCQLEGHRHDGVYVVVLLRTRRQLRTRRPQPRSLTSLLVIASVLLHCFQIPAPHPAAHGRPPQHHQLHCTHGTVTASCQG